MGLVYNGPGSLCFHLLLPHNETRIEINNLCRLQYHDRDGELIDFVFLATLKWFLLFAPDTDRNSYTVSHAQVHIFPNLNSLRHPAV